MNRKQTETACAVNYFDSTRKRMRNAKNEEIGVALLKWISAGRNPNIILIVAVLKEKKVFWPKLQMSMILWVQTDNYQYLQNAMKLSIKIYHEES